MARRPIAAAATILTFLAVLVLSGERSVGAAAGTVHFTAAGDFGSTSYTDGVLTGMAAAAPDLSLALGDLSYAVTGTEQGWCDFVTTRMGAGYPFELVSGNHESDGLNGNINDFGACLPNQLPGVVGSYGRQWYADYPRQNPLVRFVMISPGLTYPDGAWSYARGTPRYQWTASAIDGARSAAIPWVVVGMHKPCVSVGGYACDSDTDLNDLLLQKKVDLVLSGHEHLYQRTKQLTLRASCPTLTPGTFSAACVTDDDNDLVRGAGTVFATVGTGGQSLRDVNFADPEMGYFAATMGASSSPSRGFLDVSADTDVLTARFAPTSGTFTDSFTIRKDLNPVANQPPVASFDAVCTGLSCAFDGSASSDPDGSVTSYAWAFGDGDTSTLASPTKVYATAGTYTASLVVTDDRGASTSVARSVSVFGGPPPLAADDFTRSVASGLGTADVGGAWTVRGSSSAVSVSAGAARFRVAAGASPGGYLNGLSTTAADLRVSLTSDKVPAGTATLRMNVLARKVPNAGYYQAKLLLYASGAVRLYLERVSATGVESAVVPSTVVPGLTYAAGDVVRVRFEASGTSPTTVRAKVWREGSSEPTAWLSSGTDTTAGLQAPGGIGVILYLSSGATNTPATVSMDDLRVEAATP